MKILGWSQFTILALTLAVGSSAFASTISFYLNTDETPGQPPANTIEVQVNVTSPDAATVTVTNLDPSNDLYNIHNFFLNVSGSSAIGSCVSGQGCTDGAITSTPSGQSFYYVSNQGGGYGSMTYNVVDTTAGAATSVTVDLTATNGNSWANAADVLKPDGSGWEASVELYTQSGYQAAGNDTAPEPPDMLLMSAGLLALGLLPAFKRKFKWTA
jgi:hypothetical protein